MISIPNDVIWNLITIIYSAIEMKQSKSSIVWKKQSMRKITWKKLENKLVSVVADSV